MDIVIDGRKYDLCFGFDALDYLDKVYTIEDRASGIAFGYGLPLFVSALKMKNVTALYHGIKAGTSTEASKPSKAGIESFVAEALEKDGAGSLFGEMQDELGKQPLTKSQMASAQREIEKTAGKKA